METPQKIVLLTACATFMVLAPFSTIQSMADSVNVQQNTPTSGLETVTVNGTTGTTQPVSFSATLSQKYALQMPMSLPLTPDNATTTQINLTFTTVNVPYGKHIVATVASPSSTLTLTGTAPNTATIPYILQNSSGVQLPYSSGQYTISNNITGPTTLTFYAISTIPATGTNSLTTLCSDTYTGSLPITLAVSS